MRVMKKANLFSKYVLLILLMYTALCHSAEIQCSMRNNDKVVLSIDELIQDLTVDPTIAKKQNINNVKHFISLYNRKVIEFLIDNIDEEIEIKIHPDEKRNGYGPPMTSFITDDLANIATEKELEHFKRTAKSIDASRKDSKSFVKIRPYDPNNQLQPDEHGIVNMVNKGEINSIPLIPPKSGFFTFLTYVNGKTESVLTESFESDFFICEILHEKLWHYSNSKSEAHKLFLIMELIKEKEELYWNWRALANVRRDIKAYLRVYSQYEEWPTLRTQVYNHLNRYTAKWDKRKQDTITLVETKGWIEDRDELLKIADDKGYDAAILDLNKQLWSVLSKNSSKAN